MASSYAMVQRNRWWRKTIEKHGGRDKLYFAKHPHPITENARPSKVDHAFSAGIVEGYRHYAFKERSQINAFLNNNPNARECHG